MSEARLLLCCDMDRTVIPNGAQVEHPAARKRLAQFCQQKQVVLVYVTGRHLQLVEEAIEQYTLPQPDYLITDVGTKIYQFGEHRWQAMQPWEEQIDKQWNGLDHQQLQTLLSVFSELELQEQSKQNTHKLSYYLPKETQQEPLLSKMLACLAAVGVQASLVWSMDEIADVCLLDVLPKHATKLDAINFLRRHLDYKPQELLFAGDSGNDLSVMASSVPSVLVANASSEVKEKALQMVQQNDNACSLYFASGLNSDMNGNYAAGIVEGVYYFHPEFHPQLRESGFS